jgi:hypothetical protein
VVGSIGIDVQAARAAACLLEWPDQATGGAARQGAIGDGRRLLIPVATATDDAGEGRWGSAAAEEVLSRLTADGAGPTAGTAAGLAPALLAWQGEPWSEEFLGGLRQRLLRYLGLPESGPVRGHQLLFCADPGPDGDWPGPTRSSSARRTRCCAAGWPATPTCPGRAPSWPWRAARPPPISACTRCRRRRTR